MAEHSKTVLFLGAGASAAFGFPVTSQILPKIRECIKERTLFTDYEVDPFPAETMAAIHRKWEQISWMEHVKVFPAGLAPKTASHLMDLLDERLRILLPGIDTIGNDLPLITDVLSLIDHLLSAGDVPSPRFQTTALEELRALLERAILQVLHGPSDQELAQKNEPLLVKLAEWMRTKGESDDPITVISTNYDMVLERKVYPLLTRPIHEAVDFGFSWRDPMTGSVHNPPDKPMVRIFKLHGSVNWVRCQLCGFVYINKDGPIFHQAFRETLDWCNTCECLHGPVRAVIVAPSMVRQIRDPNLLTIWQRSQEAMRNAEKWIIAGYSLPSEDLAIRSILMRAERGHTGPLDIDVIEKNAGLKSRFKLLFPGCTYKVSEFQEYIKDLTNGGEERKN